MGIDEQVSYFALTELGSFPRALPWALLLSTFRLGEGRKNGAIRWIKVNQATFLSLSDLVTGKFEQQRTKQTRGKVCSQTMCRVNSIRPDPTKSNHFFVWMVVGLPQRYGHME